MAHWPLWASLLVMAVVILSPLVGQHWFRNLEPYPDGLMYVVPPLQFIKTGQWLLSYNDLNVLPNVPPLYSVVLMPFLLIWFNPASFIWLNLGLQAVTVVFLYLSLRSYLKSQWLLAGVLLLYSSNALIWWYSSLPMAEHLGLMLTAGSLYFLTTQRRDAPLGAVLCAVGLLLTKYIYYPVAVVIAGWTLLNLARKRRWREVFQSGLVFVVGLALALAVQYAQQSGPLLEALDLTFATASSFVMGENQLVFFSPSFLGANLQFYLKSVFGVVLPILWQPAALTSFATALVAVAGLVILLQTQPQRAFILMSVLISQFLLLLHFYVQDQRYGLLSIIILIWLVAVAVSRVEQRRKSLWVPGGLVLVLVLTQAYAQQNLIKLVVSANFLQRTEAWQYQAVQTLNREPSLTKDSYLISALPPYLVTSYVSPQFKLLPLSADQEFIAKGQNAWNSELKDRDRLLTQYGQWLTEGRKLYISNAYITHQQSVIADFEEFKQSFELELISEGCQQTCNLYRLNQKSTMVNP